MHPVITHLLARKDKHAPFHDRRKITLILPGGLMTSVRGAGAVLALQELGLTNSFDRIYTMSGGFPNAIYFLSRSVRECINIYYEEMCGKDFLNVARFWEIVDIDYILHIIKSVRPFDHKKVSFSKTELFVRLLDVHTDKTEYKKVNGRSSEEIERLIRAATSVPFLNPGAVKVNERFYKDAGTLPYLEDAVREVLEGSSTDILLIYNSSEQFEHLKRLGIKDSQRLFQITPYNEEKLGRTCRNPQMLKHAAEEMATLVKGVCGNETPVVLD